ncbi:MAG: class I SAM-dependent methyltransferase [Acetivibrionales bacterium]|jgi:glycine/sarcosine N-methyltransferase
MARLLVTNLYVISEGEFEMIYKDEYANWAQSYDKFGEITDINDNEKAFFSRVLEKYKVKNALDCACGTGPHLYLLSQLGVKVFGSDYSEAMLKVANENLSKVGIEVITRKADFRYLENVWNEKFDAVLCMTQSIAHLHSQEDLVTAFKSMRMRLNNGGILIMSQGTTHLTLQERFRFDLVVNNKDFSRVFVRDISDGFQTVNILDIYHGDNESKMEINRVHIKIILDDEYRKLLQDAGFSNVNIYGGYDMCPYDKENSWKLIVVAENNF